MKHKRKNSAVTPIIGTVLLLGIAVALFAILNIIVFSYPIRSTSPSVNLVAKIVDENTQKFVQIEHFGGESLPPETKVFITIGNTLHERTIGDPGLHFGEIVRYLVDLTQTIEPRVSITVVDVETNSIILAGVLQEGGN